VHMLVTLCEQNPYCWLNCVNRMHTVGCTVWTERILLVVLCEQNAYCCLRSTR